MSQSVFQKNETDKFELEVPDQKLDKNDGGLCATQASADPGKFAVLRCDDEQVDDGRSIWI